MCICVCVCDPQLFSPTVTITAPFQEELAVIHGKVRTLIAANRTDLPPVDVEPIQTREKSPGPMHTPKDLLEMEGC